MKRDNRLPTLVKLLLLAVFLVLLSGCAAQGLQGMSPEQIKAAGKDATAICTEAFSPWGRGRTVYLNVDRAVIQSGGFTVDKDCALQFHNSVPMQPVLQNPVKP